MGWNLPLLSGYEYRHLPKLFRSKNLSFFLPVVYGIRKALKEKNWDAIWIHGYNHYALIIVMILAYIYRLPLFFRSESNLQSTKYNFIKDIFIRLLIKVSKGLLYIGKDNRDYYKFFGAKENKLFFTPYAVDNNFFQQLFCFHVHVI